MRLQQGGAGYSTRMSSFEIPDRTILRAAASIPARCHVYVVKGRPVQPCGYQAGFGVLSAATFSNAMRSVQTSCTISPSI